MRAAALRPTAVAGLVLGGLAAGTVLLPALARADGGSTDDGTDKQVSVLVIGPTPSPTPTGSPSATRSASSGPSPSSGTSSTPIGGPSTGPSATGRPPHGEGGHQEGGLFVGDLRCVYHFSFNPFAGSMELSFTVQNEYPTALDGSARFWLTNIFGGTIGAPATVPVPQLRPHETRLVSATIDGVAQWTFVTAHATFTPPPHFGGTVVLTVVREARPFVPPWVVVPGAAVGAAAFGGRRLWPRVFRPPAPRALTAAEEVES